MTTKYRLYFYTKLFFFCAAICAAFLCAASSFILLGCNSNKKNDDDMSAWIRAKTLFDEGKFEQTVQLLKTDKRFVPSIVLCGKAYYFSGDYTNAEKSLSLAIKKRPTAVEAKIYLARTFRESDKSEKAKVLIDEILSDDPQNVRALRLAADMEHDRGPEGNAASLAYLDRIVDASGEAALAIMERARIRWVLGRKDDALRDLAGAKVLFPANTSVPRIIDDLQKTINGGQQ